MKTIVWFVLVLRALSAADKDIKVKLGQKTTIECGVTTYSNNLKWQHEGNLIISVDGKSGFSRKGKNAIAGRSSLRGTSLVINTMQEEDIGKFTCIADGTSQQYTLFVLSVSVSPSSELQPDSKATLQCQVKGLNVSLQWKNPDGSKLTKSHTVQLTSVALSDAGTWVCTFSHAGQTYSENLDITVKEFTTKTPMSTSRTSKDISVIAPPSSYGLLGLNWWVWVAVGVGSLVVVLLIVLVIILCKRIKRRKKRLLKMKNTRQLLKSRQYCQCDHSTAAAKPQQGRRREKPSALPLQPLIME